MYNKAIPRMFNLQEKYAINNSKKPLHPIFGIRSLLLRKLFFYVYPATNIQLTKHYRPEAGEFKNI